MNSKFTSHSFFTAGWSCLKKNEVGLEEKPSGKNGLDWEREKENNLFCLMRRAERWTHTWMSLFTLGERKLEKRFQQSLWSPPVRPSLTLESNKFFGAPFSITIALMGFSDLPSPKVFPFFSFLQLLLLLLPVFKYFSEPKALQVSPLLLPAIARHYVLFFHWYEGRGGEWQAFSCTKLKKNFKKKGPPSPPPTTSEIVSDNACFEIGIYIGFFVGKLFFSSICTKLKEKNLINFPKSSSRFFSLSSPPSLFRGFSFFLLFCAINWIVHKFYFSIKL